MVFPVKPKLLTLEPHTKSTLLYIRPVKVPRKTEGKGEKEKREENERNGRRKRGRNRKGRRKRSGKLKRRS